MRTQWRSGDLYSWTAYLTNGSGIAQTGQAGSFTTKLAKDDTYSVISVSVAEIDSVNLPGWYKITYTPNAVGHWVCIAVHATFAPFGWTDDMQAYTRTNDNFAYPAVDGTNISDDLLKRDLSHVEASASQHTLAGAVAKLVNHNNISGAILTVFKTDGSTPMYTQTVTTDSSANPIVDLN